MILTTLQDPRLLAWANARLKTSFEPNMCRWVAGFDEGGVIFVVIYDNFSDCNCALHLATDGTKRWCTRRSLRLIFEQPFRTWGLRRCTFIVHISNAMLIDLLYRLGATLEGRLQRWWGEGEEDDGLLFGLLEKECRWVKSRPVRPPRQRP